MTETTTRPLAPVADRRELPADPLHRGDIPPGQDLRTGRLTWIRSERARPLMLVKLFCPRCRSFHFHPWRWTWGLDPDVVSYQAALCRDGNGDPYWIGLSPVLAPMNARIHQQAREAFLEWEARGERIREERERLKAERRAAAAVEAEAASPGSQKQATPAPVKPVASGLWSSPVGIIKSKGD